MQVFLNGKLVPEKKATVSIQDHGFLYGDGVYETIRVYGGRPFLLHEHLRRLNNSMRGIRLTPPLSLIDIGHAVQKTILANRHKEAVIRLTVTRGPGAYGFDPALCDRPTLVITSTPFKPYPREYYRKGILVAVVSIQRNSPAALPPDVKSTSCLNGILAKMESLDLAAQEGLFLTEEGTLCEGTVSNVFLVKGDELLTPRLEGTLLPGVTREWVCMLARSSGIKVQETRISVSALIAADEIFLTNTTMEIMPVSRVVLNHTPRRKVFRTGPYAEGSGHVGPMTFELMARFRQSVQRFQGV